MNTKKLALDYLERAQKRYRALTVLMEEKAYADVVREGQEVLELILKGVLRFAGVEPPKKQDVGAVLQKHRDKLPSYWRDVLREVVQASRDLSEQRAQAFYGDEGESIPASELFTQEDAEKVREIVEGTLSLFERWTKEQG